MSFPTPPTVLSVPEKANPNKGFSQGNIVLPQPVITESVAAPAKGASPARIWFRPLLFLCLAGSGFWLDWFTKTWVFQWHGWPDPDREVWWLIPEHLGVQTSVNPGAMFGLGAGFTSVFAIFSFVALGAIGYFAFLRRPALEPLLFYTLAFVVAGILGNLYDRLGLHHTPDTPSWARHCVRDWILFVYHGVPLCDPWPNFNVADCFLVLGAIIIGGHSLRPDSVLVTEPSEDGVR